jgi:hypothetical protein
MHSKYTAGATDSFKDSFDIFFILEGEISSTWVQFIQNEYLIGVYLYSIRWKYTYLCCWFAWKLTFFLDFLLNFFHFFVNSVHFFSHFSVLLSGLVLFLAFRSVFVRSAGPTGHASLLYFVAFAKLCYAVCMLMLSVDDDDDCFQSFSCFV